MAFTIKATTFLLGQLKAYDKKTKRILFDKKELLKINPYRYKKVRTESYRHVLSIKFSRKGQDKSIALLVLGDTVFLCFILDRSKEYNDLERYLKKIEQEIR